MSSSSDLSSFDAIPPHCPPHPVLVRGESWLAAAAAVLPRQQTSVRNGVMETHDIQTLISSNVDACKVLALTTITAVSVCLSVLLEHRTTLYAGTVVLLAVLANC